MTPRQALKTINKAYPNIPTAEIVLEQRIRLNDPTEAINAHYKLIAST